MRDLPGSRTLCLMIIQGDLPVARTLCLMTTKGVPHTTRYPEDMTKCWGSKRKKAWYTMPVPGRFLENVGTHIFFKKSVPHITRQLSGL